MSSQDMNLSVNGNSKVPPGFRFHPTEEELLHYYLRKKLASDKIDLDVIRDVDLNKLEPWEIQERCKIGSTPQNDWYLFSHKDKKYPTGTRTNRATAAGFWKATGRDKVIHSNFQRIGMRKTLVFYRGRAPHGQKSDWIMHEYRLDDNTTNNNAPHAYDSPTTNVSGFSGDTTGPEEGWVVCRVFKKKKYHKALESPAFATSSSTAIDPRNDAVLDQLIMYMGRNNHNPNPNHNPACKQESEPTHYLHLPELEIPTMNTIHDDVVFKPPLSSNNDVLHSDWATLDQLVAAQLNDEFPFSFDHEDDVDDQVEKLMNMNRSDRVNESDLCGLGRSPSSSSSDLLCHLSVEN